MSDLIDNEDATPITRLDFAFIDITYSESMGDGEADDEMRAQTQFRQRGIQVINISGLSRIR